MDLIDTSALSLFIGAVVFITVAYAVKYYLEHNNNELEYNMLIGYSAIAGLITSLIVLIVYKKVLISNGNNAIMTDNFYE